MGISPETWVHVVQTVVAGLFLAGFYFASREGKERATVKEVAQLRLEIVSLRELLSEKADCDAMTAFAARVDEDLKRGRVRMDKLTEEMTKVQVDCRGHQVRLDGIERHVDDLHRKVFNG